MSNIPSVNSDARYLSLAAALSVSSISASEVYSLDEMDPAMIEQGFGTAQIGRCMDGGPIVMGGKVYAKGIGTHSVGMIELNLDGEAEEFSAVVGGSDRMKGKYCGFEFQVQGDGKTLWSSGVMTSDSPPRPVSVKLTGVEKLILRVEDGGNGNSNDHANWADASIRYSGAVPKSGKTYLNLATDALAVSCFIDKNGVLAVESFGASDGSWKSPFTGPLYPGSGDCDYHDAPVSIRRSNGDSSLQLIYQGSTSSPVSDGIQETVITLRDRVQPVFVDLHFKLFSHQNVIEQSAVLRNGLDEPIKVERLNPVFWQTPSTAEPYLEWYDSRWGDEARTNKEKLAKGRRLIENRNGNRHIEGPVPAFVMSFGGFADEERSPCMIASLAWSGSMAMSFDHDNKGVFAASLGVSGRMGDFTLEPGKSLMSPACIYTFSHSGKGAASRDLHQWTRLHGMRDGDRLRLVDNNSWEGCQFNVKEDMVIDMIKGSADLGIELYVLDDGWFGNGINARTGDASGLGDWEVNRERFPNGLGALVKAAEDAKVKFGLWFEPEMINPRSDLFSNHPDWILRSPNRELVLERNQAVLDLTNPAVRDFVFRTVDDALAANPGIRFIKWDANSSIHNPYSPHLAADRQGDLLWSYFDGYYGVLDRLVGKHPGVDFQACSSGSGRADHGAMKYSHTFWVSDNTNPLYRLGAQWNYSTFLPAIAATCHVTHSGDFKPKFRFDVSMMGQLGLEIDPRRSEPEFQSGAITGVAAYKRIRDIVQFGDQFRHASPFDSEIPSLNYVSRDKSRALVLAYQLADRNTAFTPVSGLDSVKTYELTEINLPAGDEQSRIGTLAIRTKSGRAWMEEGIPLVFTRRNDSAALLLTELSGR